MNAETARYNLERLVALYAMWSHEEWRAAAVDFVKCHASACNIVLQVLISSSDPAHLGGHEAYSDRLWRNAARVALARERDP